MPDGTDQERDPRPDLAYSRTHLANQRTYAAWLRTGLSIAVVGFAGMHVAPRHAVDVSLATAFGGALVLVAIAVILFGAWSFRRIGRTLAGAGTPIPRFTGWLVYASASTLAILLALGLLLL